MKNLCTGIKYLNETTAGVQDHLARHSAESVHEPQVCKVFGCGKTLTMEESLYGGRCVNHQIVNLAYSQKVIAIQVHEVKTKIRVLSKQYLKGKEILKQLKGIIGMPKITK